MDKSTDYYEEKAKDMFNIKKPTVEQRAEAKGVSFLGAYGTQGK